MTVLHQALKLMTNESLLFYADTLHMSYGVKPKDKVKKYIVNKEKVLPYLQKEWALHDLSHFGKVVSFRKASEGFRNINEV